MREFNGRVAVVTGAASGIGRAMAERFAREGMKLVLADVEQEPLAQAEAELRSAGATALAVPTDVTDGAAVEALAQRTIDTFGAVHLVCNNAGVTVRGRTWEYTDDDWAWVLGVNLWGVIHGISAFIPRMLAQDTDGHIVNTASLAGLVAFANAAYTASKFAVVGLSETLAKELELAGAKVKVSVLCPGFVRTHIAEAARNRPAHLGAVGAVDETGGQQARAAIAAGTPPELVADHVFEAVRAERFYILPHPGFKPAIRERMEDILAERNPRPTPRGPLAAQSTSVPD